MPMPMKTKIVANGKIDANADANADAEVRHRRWTKISFTYCSFRKIISCM